MLVAAVDIGTNSVKMLIARRRDDQLEHLDDVVIATRLGRGVDRTGQLAEAAIHDTLAALRKLAERIEARGCKVGAVATSAVRDATNGVDLLAPAADILGVQVEPIAGIREARLSFAGALAGLDVAASDSMIIDVGGGSTELVQLDGDRLVAESLDVGCVRMTERHGVGAPATPAQLRAMRQSIRDALADSKLGASQRLVANSGTATALAAIAGAVVPYERARIHGITLAAEWLGQEVERLAAMTHEERLRVPGLAPQRADIIVAGAAILSLACEKLGAEQLLVSDGGVRHGLALEIIGKFRIDPT